MGLRGFAMSGQIAILLPLSMIQSSGFCVAARGTILLNWPYIGVFLTLNPSVLIDSLLQLAVLLALPSIVDARLQRPDLVFRWYSRDGGGVESILGYR